LLERLGQHDRDWLTDKAHSPFRERRARKIVMNLRESVVRSHSEVGGGEDLNYPRHRCSVFGVDDTEGAVRYFGTDEDSVQFARKIEVSHELGVSK
jgi:hypothetical protein